MIKKDIEPGSVLYDALNDWLVVYSGRIVEDDLGQLAILCLNKENESKGVIYTVWVARKYLHWVGVV